MTLTQMTYFEAVCQYKNVTKAADALFVSRSAVSRALKELEQEWNVVLFRRSRTGVELTDDGEKIRELFREFNDAYSNLRKYMSEAQRGQKQTTLHIGFTTTTGSRFFEDFFPRFRKLHPEIRMEFTEINPSDAMPLLQDGSLDFFITPHVTPEMKSSGELETHLTYTAELVIGISADHPYASEPHLKQEQLKALEFATLLSPLPTDVLNTPFEDDTFQFAMNDGIILRSSQHKVIRRAVAAGFCATILPRDLMEGWNNVSVIPFDPPNYAEVNAIWNKASSYSDIATTFIEYLREYKF